MNIRIETVKYRFSGHETFVCRYPWLPKAVRAVSENSEIFSDEDEAMVTLGVGKNMVRSIRFWADSLGVIEGKSEKDEAPLFLSGKGMVESEKVR